MGWQPRLVNLPRASLRPRTQCPACVGGGEINDLLCATCGGRGWHDAAKPPAGADPVTGPGAYERLIGAFQPTPTRGAGRTPHAQSR
jgi:hypothetical protein